MSAKQEDSTAVKKRLENKKRSQVAPAAGQKKHKLIIRSIGRSCNHVRRGKDWLISEVHRLTKNFHE